MSKINLEEIKKRAKEGAHYAHWLYVPALIEEIERLQALVPEEPNPAHQDLRDS